MLLFGWRLILWESHPGARWPRLTSHKRRKSPLRDSPWSHWSGGRFKVCCPANKGSDTIAFAHSLVHTYSDVRHLNFKTWPASPFCTPTLLPPKLQDALLHRFFFFCSLMDSHGAISTTSEEGDPCGAYMCVKLTVKWRRGPFDYHPISLWWFLPPACKSWHRVPHLFATTECSEVYQDRTVILSQRHKSPKGIWSKDWIFFFFLLYLHTVKKKKKNQNKSAQMSDLLEQNFLFFFSLHHS